MATKSIPKDKISFWLEPDSNERTYWVTWSGNPTHTSSVTVTWKYKDRNGSWYVGNQTKVTEAPWQSNFNAPDNAIELTVTLKANSAKKKSGKKYFTSKEVEGGSATLVDEALRPASPSVNVTVRPSDGKTVELRTSVSDSKTGSINYFIYRKDHKEALSSFVLIKETGFITVVNNQASVVVDDLQPGYDYQVRAIARNDTVGITSNFTDNYSEIVIRPKDIAESDFTIKQYRKASPTSWIAELNIDGDPNTAESYIFEFVVDSEDFEINPQSQEVPVTEMPWRPTLELGRTYMFRVKAVNGAGASEWCLNHTKIIIGRKPDPPTTWSSTSSVKMGDTIDFYWTHNSTDASEEYQAKLYIGTVLNGEITWPSSPIVINKTQEDREEGKISTYKHTVSPSSNPYSGLAYYVQTVGADLALWSDASIIRVVDVYATPTLSVSVTGASSSEGRVNITGFPINVKMESGPVAQTPLNYYLELVSNDTYETVSVNGEDITVYPGDVLFSKNYDVNDLTTNAIISPGDVTLESNQEYALSAVVTMNSGLTARTELTLFTDLEDFDNYLDADVDVDPDHFYSSITPFCVDVDDPDDGTEYNRTDHLVSNVKLSVFRIERDGTFTLIADNLPNDGITTVIDPYPNLDYVVYRIVGTSLTTGRIDYDDTGTYDIECKSLVIQWDEHVTKTSTDFNEEVAEVENKGWNGSTLILPYNIDISESHSKDVESVRYAGRKYGVSYYGTSLGSSATWRADIPKSDIDTINSIRRLAAYNGNCYVREPYGTGYLAIVTASIDIKHKELVVPVSISIERVEEER